MSTQPPPAFEPEGFFSGIKAWPVVLGVLVDWVMTTLFSILLTAWFIAPGTPTDDEEAFNAAYQAMLMDAEFLLASLVFGLSATVIGAFVGASRAGVVQLKHGFVIALASGLSSLLLYWLPDEATSAQLPVWYNLLGWLLLLPAGILGGYLARQRQSENPN